MEVSDAFSYDSYAVTTVGIGRAVYPFEEGSVGGTLEAPELGGDKKRTSNRRGAGTGQPMINHVHMQKTDTNVGEKDGCRHARPPITGDRRPHDNALRPR